MKKIICDFCSSDPAPWAYHCASFVDPMVTLLSGGTIVSESVGGWAACDLCHDIIERGDKDALAIRCAGLFMIEHPELVDHAEAISSMTILTHELFFQHRIGAAYRVAGVTRD